MTLVTPTVTCYRGLDNRSQDCHGEATGKENLTKNGLILYPGSPLYQNRAGYERFFHADERFSIIDPTHTHAILGYNILHIPTDLTGKGR